MVRSVAVVVALSLLVSAAVAQTQPGPRTQAPANAAVAKKPVAQGKAGAKDRKSVV